MALTSLQKSRISFHLDFLRPDNLLALDRDVAQLILTTEEELATVGEDPAPVGNQVTFEGQILCTATSALGRCETAYTNLSPATVSDSLLVKQAGKVTLRSDELHARRSLYDEQVRLLAQTIGAFDPGCERVGFAGGF